MGRPVPRTPATTAATPPRHRLQQPAATTRPNPRTGIRNATGRKPDASIRQILRQYGTAQVGTVQVGTAQVGIAQVKRGIFGSISGQSCFCNRVRTLQDNRNIVWICHNFCPLVITVIATVSDTRNSQQKNTTSRDHTRSGCNPLVVPVLHSRNSLPSPYSGFKTAAKRRLTPPSATHETTGNARDSPEHWQALP